MRQPDETSPTTHFRCVKNTTLSSVGSRGRVWRRTMTMCRRKQARLCISQPSHMMMVSRRSWLACQMMRPSGSGNHTLPRISDGMTITNAPSNTGVETSSKPWDGWCGSQPMPSISHTPHSIALTAIQHRNASIPTSTLQTGGGSQR